MAVLLVVLFHAGIPWMEGGYVGVDVFFVLSGFLITGLLIRERLSSSSTSMIAFYARRVRRILPASTLVLIVAVIASYHWLGFLRGNVIATDGKWTALFAANVRFAVQGTQYLNANAPPSPLQHYWSLAVEEQFYLVWPVLFLVLASTMRNYGLRTKLTVVLTIVLFSSLAWSVIESSQNGTWAFFSPFTRAWELALGAILAVVTPLLLRVPSQLGPWMNWIGLVAVLGSAFLINGHTTFPGYAAVLPVVGAGLVVAGSTASPGRGAEILLRLRPFQWLGRLSFSLYLWHWPILAIAAERAGVQQPVLKNLAFVVFAAVCAALTYALIENPVRFARSLTSRPLISLTFGIGLIACAYFACSWQLSKHERHRQRTALGLQQPPSQPTIRPGVVI